MRHQFSRVSTRERRAGPERLPGRDGIGLGLPCNCVPALHEFLPKADLPIPFVMFENKTDLPWCGPMHPERSLVQFPGRAYTQISGSIPSRGI